MGLFLWSCISDSLWSSSFGLQTITMFSNSILQSSSRTINSLQFMSPISWVQPVPTPLQIWQMKSSTWSQQLVSLGDSTPFYSPPSSQIRDTMRGSSSSTYNEQPPPPEHSSSTTLVSLASCRQEENSQRDSVTVWCQQHSSPLGSAWGPASLCEAPV